MMIKNTMIRRYNVIKAAGVLLLVLVTLWCIFGIKANAAERAKNDRMEYQLQEKEFIKEVRDCLETHGYLNSGITLTKIMEGDSRDYTVRIHHAYIDTDNEKTLSKVYAMLDEVTMEGENVTVNYVIF